MRDLIKGFERLNKRKKKMLQGYCYSSPLAQRADHPLVPSILLGAEWHFCSWLTEVKEANYWLSSTGQLQTDFTAGKYGLFYHKDGCDDSYFCVIVRKKTDLFSPSSDLCRCLLKTTVNMLVGNGNAWGTGFPMLTVYSAFSVSVWMRGFKFIFLLLFSFFTLKLQLILTVEFS